MTMATFGQRVVAVAAAAVLWAGAWGALAQPAPAGGPAATGRKAWPLTRPEATSFAETSRYDDVIVFMRDMDARSPRIHLTTYGYTYEGRPMPLAVMTATAFAFQSCAVSTTL